MIQNYWNSAWRNIMKRKKFSFINISGLAIGMASALLILTYVAFEFSFDKMHRKSARIYRVQSTFHEGEVLTDDWATSSFGYGSAMKEHLAGIEDYTRVGCIIQPEQLVRYGELCLREDGIAYADPGFFRLFDFEWVKGDRASCLSMPGQVVITERMAQTFFKDEEPIGKILVFNSNLGKSACEVTGVIKEMPSNSHIHYNFLLSYATLPDWMQEYWYKHEAYTYVLLDSPERKEEIERAFPLLAEKYKTEEALKNKTWGVRLEPLERAQPCGRKHTPAVGNRPIHGIHAIAVRHTGRLRATQLHAPALFGDKDRPDSGHQIPRSLRRNGDQDGSHAEGYQATAAGIESDLLRSRAR